MDQNASATEAPSSSECLNPHHVSEDFIYGFVEVSDVTVLIATLVSALLQVYVMRIATQYIRRGASDQCLHIFLLSMTIGDFLLTGACYPIELLQRAQIITSFPYIVNLFMHLTTWIALCGSSLSLILLNVDKLMFFKYPLRYSTVVTRTKGLAILTAVWGWCVVFVLFAWVTGCFGCLDDQCQYWRLMPGNTLMYATFTFFVCVLPTVTSLVVALYILKVVSSHKKQIAEEQKLCPTASTSAVSARLRTFYFIFMTTVFTALTLLPYRFFSIKRAIDPDGQKYCITYLFLWILNYLVMLNSILNPLITLTVLPQYRNHWYTRLRKERGVATKSTTAEL